MSERTIESLLIELASAIRAERKSSEEMKGEWRQEVDNRLEAVALLAIRGSLMTNPGHALQALRPLRTVTCAVCGKDFTARDTRAKFCSNRCKQADKYRRTRKFAKTDSRND